MDLLLLFFGGGVSTGMPFDHKFNHQTPPLRVWNGEVGVRAV